MIYIKYILKRILMMIPILIIVSLIIFMVIRASGVNPISVIGGDKSVTEEVKAELTSQYHLDKPLIEQYYYWIDGIFKGNLGLDYINRQSVSSLIASRIPITLGLVLLGMLIAVVVAFPLGILAALKKNTWVDQLISIFVLILSSTPNFLASIIMLVVISKFFANYQFIGTYSNATEFFQRLSVPAIALSLSPIALLTRVTRSSMIDQFKSNYITTAKSKGLSKSTIILKHGLKNGILPVLTIGAMMIGTTIAGAVLVESIFSLPGIGGLLITGIKTYNYPVVQTLLLILLVIFLVISTIVDVLYTLIDPRVKLQ